MPAWLVPAGTLAETGGLGLSVVAVVELLNYTVVIVIFLKFGHFVSGLPGSVWDNRVRADS